MVLGRRVLLQRALICYTTVARSSDAPQIALPPLRDGHRRLYLVRHGETDWNLDGRMQGSTDNALNTNGQRQAQLLSDYLRGEPIELITSSNLQRAACTADAVACVHPSAKRSASMPAFAEMCFGDLEGQRLEEARAVYDSYIASWRAGENSRRWPGPRGESPEDVASRGLAGLCELGLLPASPGAARASGPRPSERTVLVAAHGRFNKILIAALQGDLSTASDVKQGNTCINVLDFAPDGAVDVVRLDVREHLRGERALA